MSRCLMLGFKASGKTTFLAALWHLLEAAESDTRLRLRTLQPDREYLNRIRNAWLAFDEVGRTSLRAPQQVTMEVEDAQTGEATDLSVPDLSGEMFSIQWAERRAPREYVEDVRESDGALVFVHADSVRRTQVLKGSDAPTPAGEPPTASAAQDWSIESAATQVQLVEVLQFATRIREGRRPFPLSIVISAWDQVGPLRLGNC